MADIDIERKRSGPWLWALVVMLLLLALGVGWFMAVGPVTEEYPRVDTDTLRGPPAPAPNGGGAPPAGQPGGPTPP